MILSNTAAQYGGAIFANGFRSLSVMGGSNFLDNIASSGDDFYLSNTVKTFLLQDTIIKNP
jgi:predicted outer membrane repeat protein